MPSITDNAISRLTQTVADAARRAHQTYKDDRKETIQSLIDLYNGAQYEILCDDLKQYEMNERRALLQVAQCLNITKWVIDESSQAYASAPVIRVKTAKDKDITDSWKALDPMGKLSGILREAERYANLVNDVAITPGMRVLEDGPAVVWDLFTPDRYDVVQDPNDPSRPAAIAYTFLLSDDGLTGGVPQAARIIWTQNALVFKDATGKQLAPDYLPPNYDGTNPYGFVPSAIFRSTTPLFGEFYGSMATDLGLYNRELNKLLCEIRLLEKMQGFGQLVITNPAEGAADRIRVGVSSPIIIKNKPDFPAGDAKFISPGAPIEALLNAKNNLLREIAMRYGLNGEDLVSVEGKSTPQSGKSREVANERLEKRTREMQELSRAAVTELVRKTLLIAKYWQQFQEYAIEGFDGNAIPDKMSEIKVEIKFPADDNLDSADGLDIAERRAAHGLTNWAKEYMSINPEIQDEDEALRAIKDNLALNQEIQGGTALDAALAGMQTAGLDPNGQPQGVSTIDGQPGPTDTGGADMGKTNGAQAAAGGVVQDTALNGAQVTALQSIIEAAASKQIPVEAVRPIIEAAFPLIDSKIVDAIVSPLKSFKPEPPKQVQPPTKLKVVRDSAGKISGLKGRA